MDLHAGEEVVQVRGDDVLERHEARLEEVGGHRRLGAAHLEEARERRRHLDPREVLLARLGVDEDHREVEREAGDVGEGVGRVDGERGEYRVYLVAEELTQAVLLGLLDLAPAHDVDALLGEGGAHALVEDAGLHEGQVVGDAGDLLEHLARLQPGGAAHRDAGGDAALEAGDPHHEELVEVAREDREEPGALEQRDALVGGQLQDPLVELQPADLAVEEAVDRQVGCRDVLVGAGPGEAAVGRAGAQLGRRVGRRGADRDVPGGRAGPRGAHGRPWGWGGGIRHVAHPAIGGEPRVNTSRGAPCARSPPGRRWPAPVHCRPRRRARPRAPRGGRGGPAPGR